MTVSPAHVRIALRYVAGLSFGSASVSAFAATAAGSQPLTEGLAMVASALLAAAVEWFYRKAVREGGPL